MLKRFATLLTLLTALFLFNACDDAPPITKTIIDEILTENILVNQSRYTGRLEQVGTLTDFGSNVYNPIALEWNGTNLYMLAKHGTNQSASQYLFIVDKNTGKATINSSEPNLGGSFHGGRSFTQVLHTRPNDMTWNPQKNQMLATCPVLDSIVSIDINSGLVGRITFDKDFCLIYPEGDTEFDKKFGGSRVIGAGTALAYTDTGLYMWGISRRSDEHAYQGWRSYGALYKIENLRCATPIGDPIFFGPKPEDAPPDPEKQEAYAYTLCYDGQHLYMSGAHTNGLYIINTETGVPIFIAKWDFIEYPSGYTSHELGVLNIEENTVGGIWITGLAFDGQDMFAVCSFTDGLYKLEKR